MRQITLDQARRYALAAQGLDRPRPRGRLDVRHFRRVMGQLGLLQLDSVNAFSRAHYMPFFSRLGPYDRDALDRWLWTSREHFEYWGHEASVIPMAQWPNFRWRMTGEFGWKRVERMKRERPGYLENVLAQVREMGPLQVKDLHEPGERIKGEMWGWSDGKVALEALFHRGDVTVFDRRNFNRLYAVSEVVIPAHLRNGADPSPEEGQTELLESAARSLGVGTLEDLADYPRISNPEARPLVAGLVEEGRLIEVDVEGWGKTGYLHPEARLPRSVAGRALLSPFDNLVFCRPRVERLWDFHYRIEIYVPEAKRLYGYYVLPFLLDGELVARVDLKTDRKSGRLLVKGAWAEPGVDRTRVGRELVVELEEVAVWLGVFDVEFLQNGNLF